MTFSRVPLKIALLVVVIAFATWFIGRSQESTSDQQTIEQTAVKAPQEADEVFFQQSSEESGPASDSNSETNAESKTTGWTPQRDVTPLQREQLIEYLQSKWPDLMVEYDFQGVRPGFGSVEDGSYVGYFVDFTMRELSTVRHQRPVIACAYRTVL